MRALLGALIGTLYLTLAAAAAGGGVGGDGAPQPAAETHVDPRSYMHGIGAVKGDGDTYHVFFSSSGLPPTGPGSDANWTHDVYVANWSPQQRDLSKPEIFIARPEAQEPVSVAQDDAGNVMVTFEDGWNAPNTVSQRYGVYSRNLEAIRPYPLDVWSGGHSGHVAAVGDRFVVFYSDDWVDGGGVDNLGTGKGVYLKSYSAKGRLVSSVDVARGVREWWPMIAGSPSTALLVWQAYVKGATFANLKVATFNPATNRLSDVHVIARHLRYYTYSVAYVPSLQRFAVAASDVDGHGFVKLLDDGGHVSATLACMPETVREAGLVVLDKRLLVPSRDGRLLTVRMSEDSVTLESTQPSPIPWTYAGSVGLVRTPDSVHWVSLTTDGLKEADFDLHDATPPSDSDKCG
jgi:hypothetical protein